MWSLLSSRVTGVQVSWFNPNQQLSTTRPLTHCSHTGVGERVGRVKMRKLLGWDKDSLIGKAKATQVSKAK